MQVKSGRVKEKSKITKIIDFFVKYSYLETLSIIIFYLAIGYLIDPKDICLLDGHATYVLILIAIVTLFHGFENGLLAVGILSLAMWYFYPVFQYIDFLIILLMTLIYSEFHYFWTKKIKEAEINSDYKAAKLDELSRAFYGLKISHDQLEKNYVVKPMSIRHSIEKIVNMNKEITTEENIDTQNALYYQNFLTMLEKSFSVHSAFVIYKQDKKHEDVLSEDNMLTSYGTNSQEYSSSEILNDYLVDMAITKTQAIYISDDKGEPTLAKDENSIFVAAIPSIINNQVVSVLVIEKMPFMAFNRENLISVAILLEYFSLEVLERNTLSLSNELTIIEDEKFRYEYIRMKHLFLKFNVNSVVLVLRIKSEIQAAKIYEKIKSMLRSLDMVARRTENGIYYIALFFPLHDDSSAVGYLNRLLNSLDEKKDRNFEHMTFDMKETNLLNKYLKEDYDE
jgi:hypothetical protein